MPDRNILFETFPLGPLQCNCTIAGDLATGEAMVIDPGEDAPGILARLARHKLLCRQIIITHAHIDHVGGALALKRATGAPVLMNEHDSALLAMMDEQAAWIGVRTPQVAEPDIHAADGLAVGLASLPGRVLHTPGHTEGSISVHFADEQLLLAGDTLFAGSIGRTDLPGGNMRTILRSLHERILALPDETRVIAGHGPDTTIGRERETNPFLS